MAELRLQNRLRRLPRNTGPTTTAVTVPLPIPQYCMHQPVLKCVQSNAYPCQAASCTCMSGWPLENCRNRVPTRAPNPSRLMSNMSQTTEEAQESARPSVRPSYRFSLNQTHWRFHPESSREETSGLLTGVRRHFSNNPSTNKYRRLQPRHNGGHRERQKQL